MISNMTFTITSDEPKYQVGDTVILLPHIQSRERIYVISKIEDKYDRTRLYVERGGGWLYPNQVELYIRPPDIPCFCHPEDAFGEFCLDCMPRYYP